MSLISKGHFFKVLHFISIREIPAKISSDASVTTKIGNYIRKEFHSSSKVKQLLKEDRITQIRKLGKLKSHISNLLWYLFNPKGEDQSKLLREMAI